MFSLEQAAHLGGVPEAVEERLREHLELLVKWNRVINLSADRDEATIIQRHFCESLFLARHLPLQGHRVCDVGSGGGFPGIPVAIARPDCEVTLIESHQRKAVFLREATRDLKNVRVFSGRAEKVGDRFDRVISRAVNWGDLAGVIQDLGGCFSLLTGAAGLPEGVGVEERIVLPWGDRRLLCMGCFT